MERPRELSSCTSRIDCFHFLVLSLPPSFSNSAGEWAPNTPLLQVQLFCMGPTHAWSLTKRVLLIFEVPVLHPHSTRTLQAAGYCSWKSMTVKIVDLRPTRWRMFLSIYYDPPALQGYVQCGWCSAGQQVWIDLTRRSARTGIIRVPLTPPHATSSFSGRVRGLERALWTMVFTNPALSSTPVV